MGRTARMASRMVLRRRIALPCCRAAGFCSSVPEAALFTGVPVARIEVAVYATGELLKLLDCPQCGGTMKIIAFIEAHQQGIIRKILRHCGLPPEDPKGWQDPPSRGPPKPAHSPPGPKSGHQASLFAGNGDPDSRLTHELDPDFLEFARREEIDEPEPTWEL